MGNKIEKYYVRQLYLFELHPRVLYMTKTIQFIVLFNVDTQNSANLRILREPSKEFVEPLGTAEPWLKNTGLIQQWRRGGCSGFKHHRLFKRIIFKLNNCCCIMSC